MIKVILGFMLMFAAFFAGIQAFRSLSGREKWALTKLIAYSIMCAVLATATLTIFVLLF
jgi:hypothetical protein